MSGPCVISIFNHLASYQATNFISKRTMLLHAQVVPLHTLPSRPGIPCPPFHLVSTEHRTIITAIYNGSKKEIWAGRDTPGPSF